MIKLLIIAAFFCSCILYNYIKGRQAAAGSYSRLFRHAVKTSDALRGFLRAFRALRHKNTHKHIKRLKTAINGLEMHYIAASHARPATGRNDARGTRCSCARICCSRSGPTGRRRGRGC